MKVITPGHKYELDFFEAPKEGDQPQTIQFIEKVPSYNDIRVLETLHNGTTTEDVIAVAIDRLKFLNTKFPCKENSCCITHLEEGLMWLEKRTADRMKRGVEGKPVK